jgi:hypothetical protein
MTSLFLLGGDFYDKSRSLFMHTACAVIPDQPAAEGKSELCLQSLGCSWIMKITSAD